MKPGDPIVIEQAAHGWIVRPEWPRNDGIINVSDMRAYQHFAYDAAGSQSDECLFGFLLEHFSVQEQKS